MCQITEQKLITLHEKLCDKTKLCEKNKTSLRESNTTVQIFTQVFFLMFLFTLNHRHHNTVDQPQRCTPQRWNKKKMEFFPELQIFLVPELQVELFTIISRKTLTYQGQRQEVIGFITRLAVCSYYTVIAHRQPCAQHRSR